MSGGDAAAWLAAGLVVLTALAGWILRRFLSGAIAVRLRPHFVLGYAALALAAFHGMLAMGAMRVLGSGGGWLAFLAFGGLALQTYLGASLQAPGIYRGVLRRWHLVTALGVAILIAGHIALTI
jgi:hypothetical protein